MVADNFLSTAGVVGRFVVVGIVLPWVELVDTVVPDVVLVDYTGLDMLVPGVAFVGRVVGSLGDSF